MICMLKNTIKSLKVNHLILTVRKKLNKLGINNQLLRSVRELRPQTNWCLKNWREKPIPQITAYQKLKPIMGASLCSNTL